MAAEEYQLALVPFVGLVLLTLCVGIASYLAEKRRPRIGIRIIDALIVYPGFVAVVVGAYYFVMAPGNDAAAALFPTGLMLEGAGIQLRRWLGREEAAASNA